MTIDERLEALTQTVELLAQTQRDNERLIAQKFAALDESTGRLLDTMNRVGRILEIHEHRLDRLEGEQ